jgi:hypothetical protein
MLVAVVIVLLVFWAAMAFRAFQRGDLLLAGVFLAVGVALTVYRLRRIAVRSEGAAASESQQISARRASSDAREIIFGLSFL